MHIRNNYLNSKREIEEIEKELSDAKRILANLYEMNLIPSKYRNIGCAYFIHDFFSTSSVPLKQCFYIWTWIKFSLN